MIFVLGLGITLVISFIVFGIWCWLINTIEPGVNDDEDAHIIATIIISVIVGIFVAAVACEYVSNHWTEWIEQNTLETENGSQLELEDN